MPNAPSGRSSGPATSYGSVPSSQSTSETLPAPSGSLGIRPFENRHKEGRIIVWREHEHRQPLSDRRWPVSKEPDEIRTRRNNHSSKVVLRSGAHDTPHSRGEIIVSERRRNGGIRHCHRSLMPRTLGIRAVSASPRVGDKDRYPPSRVVPGNRWRCFTQAMSGWMAYAQDPILAEELVARAVVEKVDHDHVVEYQYQGTAATTNGESVWAFQRQEPVTVLLHKRCHASSAAPSDGDSPRPERRNPLVVSDPLAICPEPGTKSPSPRLV